MASFCPFSLGEDIANGNVIFGTHSFKLMLVTSSYTASQAHDRRNDVEGAEVSGTGYTAGGIAITCTVSRVNGVTSLTWSSPTWASPVSGFTARRGWIYRTRGGASSADELVACLDFGAGVAANGTSFTVSVTSASTMTVPTGT